MRPNDFGHVTTDHNLNKKVDTAIVPWCNYRYQVQLSILVVDDCQMPKTSQVVVGCIMEPYRTSNERVVYLFFITRQDNEWRIRQWNDAVDHIRRFSTHICRGDFVDRCRHGQGMGVHGRWDKGPIEIGHVQLITIDGPGRGGSLFRRHIPSYLYDIPSQIVQQNVQNVRMGGMKFGHNRCRLVVSELILHVPMIIAAIPQLYFLYRWRIDQARRCGLQCHRQQVGFGIPL